ncbi:MULTISPECIES: zinc ribbon domain-containing protein [unclassified Acinetobacter]|uniref:zinc ribbon domain-containing protein n=1 Tax=unclassified Acinetobacter TaxID=196816 RepID=UPI002934DF33|nr:MULTISPECIES: zinc ribbon domain-containing protein [unclassified Acinetobacter]WOE31984.1 zinc ribbon domain-containing protein [Acinetobacter sp. SAAs470]WOE37452.1 zinc ribbon domain-containing protein [Acinetobacter sp. SAAs474]
MSLINCKECGSQVSTQAKSCPNCGAKIKKSKSKIIWAIVIIIILGIIASLSDKESSGTQELSPKEQALRDLDFNFEWGKEGFDSVMVINMTIKNNGKKDIKDFTVECEHSSNSGTKIDSNKREVYEIIKAGETRTFNNFNMGFIHSQAQSSNCGITNLVVM